MILFLHISRLSSPRCLSLPTTVPDSSKSSRPSLFLRAKAQGSTCCGVQPPCEKRGTLKISSSGCRSCAFVSFWRLSASFSKRGNLLPHHLEQTGNKLGLQVPYSKQFVWLRRFGNLLKMYDSRRVSMMTMSLSLMVVTHYRASWEPNTPGTEFESFRKTRRCRALFFFSSQDAFWRCHLCRVIVFWTLNV